MATFDPIRHGLGRAWENLSEGWAHLRERADNALTRFHVRGRGELQTAQERIAAGGARWGLLAAEVVEKDDTVVVRLEAPGMESGDFDIGVVDGTVLVVRGEKRVQREDGHGRYYVMECAYGSFERAVPLPEAVDDGAARARYRSGVLTVTLPKRRSPAGRRIAVQG